MKKTFKVGERVIGFINGLFHIENPVKECKGVLVEIMSDGTLSIENTEGTHYFHPKNVRRLKKKARRELFVVFTPHKGVEVFYSYEAAKNRFQTANIVKFREVENDKIN